MIDKGEQTMEQPRRQWRMSAVLLIASLSVAATVTACATTLDDAKGQYVGGGGGTTAEVTEDTFSVPPPSDATISTTPPEVTTESPEEVLAYQCKVVTGYALEFLPTWQKVTAIPTPTAEQRKSVAVALIAAASKVDAYKGQIKDATLQSFAKKIVAEQKKIAELVDSGSAATLDALQSILTQTDDYCG